MTRQQAANIIPIPFLVWALVPSNPYAFYTFLRIICCGCFAYNAIQYHRANHENWVFAFVGLAIIYNPIFRIHLDRGFWSVVNVATLAILAVAIKNQHKGVE